MERWLAVVGYEGLYEVSDLGRVRRLRERRGGADRLFADGPRIVKQHERSYSRGYLDVSLYKEDKHVRRPVHLLVLEAFVGPRPAGLEGAHDDGVRSHNHLGNLLWKTHAENLADKKRHGTQTYGVDHHSAKLSTAEVDEVRQSTEPARAIARRLGVCHRTILNIRNGKVRLHG